MAQKTGLRIQLKAMFDKKQVEQETKEVVKDAQKVMDNDKLKLQIQDNTDELKKKLVETRVEYQKLLNQPLNWTTLKQMGALEDQMEDLRGGIKENEKALKDLWWWLEDTGNKATWMASAIAKWVAVWDLIKAAIKKVWDLTKQFISDSINLAIEYESAFAWVRKTVNWTEKELIWLDKSLKKLAKEIPLSYKELAKIMELWWQLWVQTKNLDKFTKAVAQLWTATNLSSEDAAEMLAQFANVTKMDLNDIDRLWSVIVDLGNNFATTESDIVNFAQNIAGIWEIAGISEANLMAIATAFTSVWVEASSWWTAVQKVLLDINSAVLDWGDQLEKYAKMVWMTKDEFKKLYEEHPEQAFVEFVKALQSSGQEAQTLLEDLWLNDQRLVKWFLSLSQNADILTDAINRSNEAWENNVALSTEAEQRYSTTESEIIKQQNERANMMAAIWEKLKWVVKWWEEVKTTFTNAIWAFLWVTTESSEATEILEEQIKKAIKAMDDLDKALDEGKISLDEWVQERIKLEEDAKTKEEALKKEQKRLADLNKEIEKATREEKFYRNEYKLRLEMFGEDHEVVKRLAKDYENWHNKLEDLLIVQQAGKKLTKEEIEQRKQQKEHIDKTKTAYDNLKAAEELLNKLKLDDSANRVQLELTKIAVKNLRKEYEKLIETQAQFWIWKSLGNRLSGIEDKHNAWMSNLLNRKVNIIKSWDDEEDWGTLWKKLLWWWGWWWKSKSKAEEMLEAFDKELEQTWSDINSLVNEHQDSYDKIIDKIEDTEKKYEQLRESAKNTWEDAEKSLREYNRELEENQVDAITNLWQRYVELKRDMIEVDRLMMDKAESLSWKTIQAYQDRWETEYEWFSLKDLIDIKEKLDEIKLIEENTTEEQRMSSDFTQKTSKAQEILNNLKEKELELEEKKAEALEKQAIAQAMMDQSDWKQYIKTLEGKGTFYYDKVKEQREKVLNEDNIEYAKQLENQITNLNSQLEEYKNEKDKEVEILTDTTAKKIQLEETYQKVYEQSMKEQEKLLDNAIEKTQKLINLRQEYLSMWWTLHNAYGWSVLEWKASIVWENWPEQIIARQSSYVQPRNAGNSYSTVNTNNLSINGLEFWNFNTIDDMLDALKERLTYRS